jgi:hypothetical protein
MLKALDALRIAWEEKKDKVCEMPIENVSNHSTQTVSDRGLRKDGVKVRPKDARRVFGTDDRWRPAQYVTNDFHVNGDGTVTDRATGLTWQQAGSDFPMTWHEACDYVEALNHKSFAKRGNWRLPTINELMTLLTDVPRAGDLCIEPVFDQNEKWLWSCDRRSFVAAWYVSADMGYISWQDFSCYYYVRAVSSDTK